MDIYHDYLVKRLEGLSGQTGAITDMELVILLKEGLKYYPRNTSVLNGLGSVLMKWKLYGEAFDVLTKSYEVDRNQKAEELLLSIEQPALPPIVTLEISTVCNLRCPICTTGVGTLNRKNKFMNPDQFCRIWDRLKGSTRMLILVGQGETFLNKHAYDMLDYVGGSTYVYIDTNGNAPLRADRILRAGVDEIVFSIDGINQEMYQKYRRGGHIEKAIDNLKNLVCLRKQSGKSKPKIVFKFVVFRHTEMYIDSAGALARSLGADEFRIEPCTFEPQFGYKAFKEFMPLGPQWQRIEFVDFEKKVVRPSANRYSRHCTAPLENIVVTVDGNVAPCCGADQNQMPIYGNLLREPLEAMWTSARARSFRLKVLRDRNCEEACKACSYPANHLGKYFEGTEFQEPEHVAKAAPGRFFVSENYVTAEELEQLYRDGREYEANYFIKIGKAAQIKKGSDGFIGHERREDGPCSACT